MKLKRILTLLTSAAMAVTVLTGAMSVSVVSAADEDYATSGTCGDEAEWFINTDTTLVITGKGALSKEIDENGSQKTWPWRKLGADIQRIVVEEGIEDLGKGTAGYPNSSISAFIDCINVKEAVLSPTVKNLYICFYGMESNIKDIWIYATDIVEDVGGTKGGLSSSNKGCYPRAGRGTKWHIYKGSTTEKTLRDAEYLTDTNVVYIANTTALEEAVKSAEEMDTSIYTDESVKALNKAIEAARAVVDDLYASPEEADNAANALSEAVKGLVKIPKGSISGTVKAPGIDTEVTVSVTTTGGEVIAEVKADGKYTVSDLEDGEYVITAAAEGCETRSYKVTVSGGDITLDDEIHIIGDIYGDGKITTTDVGLANSHAKGIKMLEGYDIEVADLSKDGKVTTTDVGAVNAKAKGVKA